MVVVVVNTTFLPELEAYCRRVSSPVERESNVGMNLKQSMHVRNAMLQNLQVIGHSLYSHLTKVTLNNKRTMLYVHQRVRRPIRSSTVSASQSQTRALTLTLELPRDGHVDRSNI